MKGKKSRRILCILLTIALLLASIGGIFLAIYLTKVNRYQNAVRQMIISDVDIQKIPDGTYVGECDVQFIYAKVAVQVQDGKIVVIELLEHRNERGNPAEVIPDTIIKEQKIKVDAISGATNSSRVIQKAVENALTLPQPAASDKEVPSTTSMLSD